MLIGGCKSDVMPDSPLQVLPWGPTPDLPLDIWVVQYELLGASALQQAKNAFLKAGKVVWGYHCVGPEDPAELNTFLDVPPIKARLIPWLAQAEGLGGWLYWYTNWGARHAATATDESTGLLVPLEPLDDRGRSGYSAAVAYGNATVRERAVSHSHGQVSHSPSLSTCQTRYAHGIVSRVVGSRYRVFPSQCRQLSACTVAFLRATSQTRMATWSTPGWTAHWRALAWSCSR